MAEEAAPAAASPWKDLPFFGAFWLTFIYIVAALAGGPFFGTKPTPPSTDSSGEDAAKEEAKNCIGGLICTSDLETVLGIGIAGAFVFTAMLGAILKKWPETIMKIALFFNVAVLAILAVIMLASKPAQVEIAVVYIVLAVLLSVYFYCQRNRIAFAALLIKCSVTAASKFPNLITATLGGIIVACVYLLIFLFAWATNVATGNKNDENVAYSILIIGGWHAMTIYYTMYAIVCGVIGTWWFSTSEKSDTPNPVLNSVKRALSWSFGSIAAGALLIFVITQLCKAARNAARRLGPIGLCITCMIVNPLQRLAEIFTGYAFVHVAVYGKSFYDGASDTARMFKERGIGSIVNADFSDRVLSFSSYMVMILTGGVMSGSFVGLVDQRLKALGTTTEAVFAADGSDLTLTIYKIYVVAFMIVFFILGLILGRAVSFVALSIIKACIATIFVCFAENPEALAAKDPELYNAFNEKWDKAEGTASAGGAKM